jgi:3D (Asp-Asp-Asp) domain-containing protein
VEAKTYREKALGMREERSSEGRWVDVWATAYCPECRVCDTTDTTATGTHAGGPGVAVAARGPRVAPLGSKVYVADLGWLPVDDTGGGVDSDQIDVRFQSHNEAVLWGRRQMRIRLDSGS